MSEGPRSGLNDSGQRAPFLDESLFAAPPAALPKRLRLSMEATTFAMQTIYHLATDVEEVARQISAVKSFAQPLTTRIRLACDCWSIVDQTHTLTELLALFPDNDQKALATFRDRYRAAGAIRRGTRHLRQQMGNLAAKKDHGAGIFGALAFLDYVGTEGDPPLHTGWFTVLHFGSLEPPGRAVKVTEDIPSQHGICNLEFLVQDHVLPISKLKANLLPLAELLEESIRTTILNAAEKAGDSVNVDELPRAHLAWTMLSLRAGWPGKGR